MLICKHSFDIEVSENLRHVDMREVIDFNEKFKGNLEKRATPNWANASMKKLGSFYSYI